MPTTSKTAEARATGPETDEALDDASFLGSANDRDFDQEVPCYAP
jgi:hypothetical protein